MQQVNTDLQRNSPAFYEFTGVYAYEMDWIQVQNKFPLNLSLFKMLALYFNKPTWVIDTSTTYLFLPQAKWKHN